MGRLLLYNPENDTALASGMRNFTPAKEPARLARDGGLLAAWWANEGDIIFSSSRDKNALCELKNRFGLHGEIYDAALHRPISVEPWGWSQYTKGLLERAGVSEAILPDNVILNTIRELSHRRTTIETHRLLGTAKEFQPVEAMSFDEAMEAIERWRGDAVIKQPWSSSGRGIFFSKSLSLNQLRSYIEGFIGKQGSVIVERRRDKIKDFALLYYSDGKTLEYKGLSIFKASETGQYGGNLVDVEEVLLDRLGLSIGTISDEIEKTLISIVLPYYKGWIGVDMMTEWSGAGNEAFVPCVEVNFRMTMGVLAHIIAERHPELRGRVLRLQTFTHEADDISLSPVSGAKYHYVLSRKRL